MTDTNVHMLGAAGPTRSIHFKSGSTNDWSKRESATKAWELYNHTTARAPFKLGNDGSVQHDIATSRRVTLNLYLDSNRALHKIVSYAQHLAKLRSAFCAGEIKSLGENWQYHSTPARG